MTDDNSRRPDTGDIRQRPDTGDLWRRDEVESPCVKVCVIHPQAGLCLGCHRSLDEIAAWSRMTPEERRAVMAELPGRAALLKGTRRGGRAARRPSE